MMLPQKALSAASAAQPIPAANTFAPVATGTNSRNIWFSAILRNSPYTRISNETFTGDGTYAYTYPVSKENGMLSFWPAGQDGLSTWYAVPTNASGSTVTLQSMGSRSTNGGSNATCVSNDGLTAFFHNQDTTNTSFSSIRKWTRTNPYGTFTSGTEKKNSTLNLQLCKYGSGSGFLYVEGSNDLLILLPNNSGTLYLWSYATNSLVTSTASVLTGSSVMSRSGVLVGTKFYFVIGGAVTSASQYRYYLCYVDISNNTFNTSTLIASSGYTIYSYDLPAFDPSNNLIVIGFRDTSGTGVALAAYQFNPTSGTVSLISSTPTNGNNQWTYLGSDDTYIWMSLGTTSFLRYLKASMSTSPTFITPGTTTGYTPQRFMPLYVKDQA